MSRETDNADVVRRMFLAMGEGSLKQLREVVDPECKLYVPELLPYGGVYTGPEAYLEYRSRSLAVQKPRRADYYEIIGSGDAVFNSGMLHTTMRNGVDVAAPMAAMEWLRDGRIVQSESYIDAARILAAWNGRWLSPPRGANPEPVLTMGVKE